MPGDTEIEIKIKIDEKTFLNLREKLKPVAEFRKKLRQVDEYFTPVHRNFVEPRFPFEWLRIGRRGDKTILNYKHFYPENVEMGTHCDEFETVVKDEDQLRKLFAALDFKNMVTVDKEREVYANEEFEIALDKVKELGHFVEIETKKDFGSVEEARKKLFEFAKKLGVDTSSPDKRGYPFLAMEKKGMIRV